jgi:hypothetical protein
METIIIWSVLYLYRSLLALEEEEEEEEDEEGDDIFYNPTPHSVIQLKHWWNTFIKGCDYPCYAIILASESDKDITNLFNNYRGEISAISDKDCCFIYFRDRVRRRDFQKHEFFEHSKHTYILSNIFEADMSMLPGIIFFEYIYSGNYAYMSLKGKNDKEIIDSLRNLFASVKKNRKINPLEAIKKHIRSNKRKITTVNIANAISKVGLDKLSDIIKSVLP